MHTIIVICAVVIAVWCVAACVVAVVVARSIRIADQRMLDDSHHSEEISEHTGGIRRPGTTSSTIRRR